MEVSLLKKILRNKRTSSKRIEELYYVYWDLVDSFELLDEDDIILMMFFDHPNCPEWIRGDINSYIEADNFDEDESGECDCQLIDDDNSKVDYSIGYDEENLHFEPTEGWISDN